MDERRTEKSDDGFGDDQGTRVGAPDQSAPKWHADTPAPRPEKQTGTGSEASEGMHDARQRGEREPSDRTGLTDKKTGRGERDGSLRSGSEPIEADPEQHRSGYGGSMGQPVRSTDEREETRER